MAKYNITPKQTRDVTYVSALSTQTVENIYEQIMLKFVVEKKYRDPSYTASKMAQELGVNTRYISAVVNLRFHDNFSQLINEFRIKEAMYINLCNTLLLCKLQQTIKVLAMTVYTTWGN